MWFPTGVFNKDKSPSGKIFWNEYVFLDFKHSLEGDFAINVDVQNPEDISLEATAQSR